MNPKNIEPISPINILAGLKLNIKKPRHAPSIINVSVISKLPILCIINAITPIVVKNIVPIPAARPSNPSIKLIIFITAIINITVNGYANQPKSK